jgi:ABC-2 type transport system ATP-binding protein
MASEIAAIETRQLTKIYPGLWKSQIVNALSDLTLTVRKGEIFGLLGPNGAGKSTTIKLLLGLINPTAGTASVLGEPAGDQYTRRLIGYLPEETYLYRFLNARQTINRSAIARFAPIPKARPAASASRRRS